VSLERIFLVGLGETGRSLGLALRSSPHPPHVVGHDRDASASSAALEVGAVDSVLDRLDAIDPTIDVVALAVPALDAPRLVSRLGKAIPAGPLLTDLSPLMLPSLGAAAAEPGLRGRFVPGYPVLEEVLEERELHRRSGPPGPRSFRGATVLIGLPLEAQSPAERVADLWRSVGAEPVSIAPALHDALVALTHDLPLVTAAAFVRTVRRTGSMTRIVAPGSRVRLLDATRALVRSKPSDSGMLALNAPKLLPALELLEREVRRFRHALAGDRGPEKAETPEPREPTELSTLLEEARRFQEELVR
jgi:prephenate dehydrogenase